MTHTPGPWSVAENLFGNTASYEVYSNAETKSGKGGYTRICQITPRDQKSNAALIAAAPYMLEALEEVVAITENLQVCPFCGAVKGVQSHRPDCLSHEINATIRKARGEE